MKIPLDLFVEIIFFKYVLLQIEKSGKNCVLIDILSKFTKFAKKQVYKTTEKCNF